MISFIPNLILKRAGIRRPQRAAQHTGQEHGEQQERPRPIGKVERDHPAKQRAHIVLSLAANVPDPRPESGGQPQADQQNGAVLSSVSVIWRWPPNAPRSMAL